MHVRGNPVIRLGDHGVKVVSGACISLASDHRSNVVREGLVGLRKTTDCDDTVGLYEEGFCATGTSSSRQEI